MIKSYIVCTRYIYAQYIIQYNIIIHTNVYNIQDDSKVNNESKARVGVKLKEFNFNNMNFTIIMQLKINLCLHCPLRHTHAEAVSKYGIWLIFPSRLFDNINRNLLITNICKKRNLQRKWKNLTKIDLNIFYFYNGTCPQYVYRLGPFAANFRPITKS